MKLVLDLREQARKEIETRSTLAFDVAKSHCQIFDNVKHLTWFLDVVEEELARNRLSDYDG